MFPGGARGFLGPLFIFMIMGQTVMYYPYKFGYFFTYSRKKNTPPPSKKNQLLSVCTDSLNFAQPFDYLKWKCNASLALNLPITPHFSDFIKKLYY